MNRENKNIVPIVFCFDDNLEMQAGVCITSLLINAKNDTFYDIYILHSQEAKFPNGKLNDLYKAFDNFKLEYISVGDAFKGAFEIRGITYAAYYRLLIPELIPQYDTIMYHDVDVIFRDDLYEVYRTTDMNGYYIGGVSTPYSDIEDYVVNTIGVPIENYIASGNLIINSKKILDDGLLPKFKELALKDWKYQDMDVINIVCKGYIKYLPPYYCLVGTTFEILNDTNQSYFDEDLVNYSLNKGIIHYNGPKPWNEWCLNYDIWWEYYRKSIFFDHKLYYNFYLSKLNELDKLSLLKRIKILVRYFVYGQYKS